VTTPDDSLAQAWRSVLPTLLTSPSTVYLNHTVDPGRLCSLTEKTIKALEKASNGPGPSSTTKQYAYYLLGSHEGMLKYDWMGMTPIDPCEATKDLIDYYKTHQLTSPRPFHHFTALISIALIDEASLRTHVDSQKPQVDPSVETFYTKGSSKIFIGDESFLSTPGTWSVFDAKRISHRTSDGTVGRTSTTIRSWPPPKTLTTPPARKPIPSKPMLTPNVPSVAPSPGPPSASPTQPPGPGVPHPTPPLARRPPPRTLTDPLVVPVPTRALDLYQALVDLLPQTGVPSPPTQPPATTPAEGLTASTTQSPPSPAPSPVSSDDEDEETEDISSESGLRSSVLENIRPSPAHGNRPTPRSVEYLAPTFSSGSVVSPSGSSPCQAQDELMIKTITEEAIRTLGTAGFSFPPPRPARVEVLKTLLESSSLLRCTWSDDITDHEALVKGHYTTLKSSVSRTGSKTFVPRIYPLSASFQQLLTLPLGTAELVTDTLQEERFLTHLRTTYTLYSPPKDGDCLFNSALDLLSRPHASSIAPVHHTADSLRKAVHAEMLAPHSATLREGIDPEALTTYATKYTSVPISCISALGNVLQKSVEVSLQSTMGEWGPCPVNYPPEQRYPGDPLVFVLTSKGHYFSATPRIITPSAGSAPRPSDPDHIPPAPEGRLKPKKTAPVPSSVTVVFDMENQWASINFKSRKVVLTRSDYESVLPKVLKTIKTATTAPQTVHLILGQQGLLSVKHLSQDMMNKVGKLPFHHEKVKTGSIAEIERVLMTCFTTNPKAKPQTKHPKDKTKANPAQKPSRKCTTTGLRPI
jgi:hypothetical protein